jgi:Ca2+-binding EF-hand superfamily protein
MDRNGDGQVTQDELDVFLKMKGVEDGHRPTIVAELFEKCDKDHSGQISLEEFVFHYQDTSN